VERGRSVRARAPRLAVRAARARRLRRRRAHARRRLHDAPRAARELCPPRRRPPRPARAKGRAPGRAHLGGTIPRAATTPSSSSRRAPTSAPINEDFAVESIAGDVFQLGNTSYRILRVEPGRVRVEDAHGAPPSIPFWLGEAPGAATSCRWRSRGCAPTSARDRRDGRDAAIAALRATIGLDDEAARQIVDHLARSLAVLGALPTQERIVIERFFDASGGMQLVVHSPFGSRLNRAWGLALRKRFCRRFNFEIQAAATEDAIVLSLSTSHSFPLDEVARYLHSATALDVLVQALLDAPLFAVRWRWNATTALALPRFSGGKKVAPQLQRMKSEDLLAAVFPDQVACAENLAGDREVPEHPLVAQTMRDCLDDAMDATGWLALLRRIESGAVAVVARDLPAPSPLAAEALSARPYAFLDDAPIEERRTQAVQNRRYADPESADELGQLDADAIASVRDEAWPQARNADEMHEALVALGVVADAEAAANAGWSTWLDELAASGRATRLAVVGSTGAGRLGLWVAAERLAPCATSIPMRSCSPSSKRRRMRRGLRDARRGVARAAASASSAASVRRRPTRSLCRSGWRAARSSSPCSRCRPKATCCRAASRRTLPPMPTSSGASGTCSRASIATRSSACAARSSRSSRATSSLPVRLAARRREQPRQRPDALAGVLGQLEGFEAPAAVWEAEILPARVQDYASPWLDDLCTAGRTLWTRLRPLASEGRAAGASLRSTPVLLLPRRAATLWTRLAPSRADEADLGSRARLVADHLAAHGASFFDEIADAVRLLPAELEDALAELVVRGRVNCDSFAGLRALLVPAAKRSSAHSRRRRGVTLTGIADAGRWSLIRSPAALADDAKGEKAAAAPSRVDVDALEHVARILLRRYGVVCWRLLEREAAWLPPWREPRPRLSPARGARRDPRRPLHRRADRRAVRAARSDRLDARGAPPAGRRRARLPRRERSGEPARHRRPGAEGRARSPAPASSGATACRWRRASAVKWSAAAARSRRAARGERRVASRAGLALAGRRTRRENALSS
jgi:ATP-dependent Lhr-like helicase